jgi:tetratricopeptide (TPR) repeat protein
MSGYPEEGIEAAQRALAVEICPPYAYAILGRALLLAGRTAEAMVELNRCAARLPDYIPCHHTIVVAALELGCKDEALAAWREVMRLYPGWVPHNNSVSIFFRREADAERFINALQTAIELNRPTEVDSIADDTTTLGPNERLSIRETQEPAGRLQH